ncbi:cytochrome b5 [Dendroctonus ponderosae]|uniref:Cytochrome b5 heme-binding domain-containing protein n=1 Tax=Dendroctonus ponderosae TaxID=77166 RepID=J3JWD7_DENPD
MAQVITNIFTTTGSSGSLLANKPISLQEVSWHDTFNDCWIVIYDRVYDITDFLNEHPGGEDILVEHAGRDATVAFRGSGHSAQAIKALDKYLIGELPQHERIFRKPGGIQLSDLPT